MLRLFSCLALLSTLLSPQGTISFRYEMQGTKPEVYTFKVSPEGSVVYQSWEKKGDESPTELQFKLSPDTLRALQSLTRETGYFNGTFDYTKTKIAQMGLKTLTYEGPEGKFSTTVNYSENPAIQQLIDIFAGISLTQEHGQRLAFLRRFDKLGLEPELKLMEESAKSGKLRELRLISPVLRSVANDALVMNVARNRAIRLLEMAESQTIVTKEPVPATVP